MLKRRGFISALFIAPAIIRTPGLLMPIKPITEPDYNWMYQMWDDGPVETLEQSINNAYGVGTTDSPWFKEMVKMMASASGVPERLMAKPPVPTTDKDKLDLAMYYSRVREWYHAS